MIPLEEAQHILLRDVLPVTSEVVSISEAYGRVLADDVDALLTQPPFDASAMDGYAIRFDDLPGPWRVVGEAAAGGAFGGATQPGEAVRIFTGAPLPAGADTVLVQEDARRDDDALTLAGDGPPRHGAHVRHAGQDFRRGQSLAAAGTRLGASLIGLIAAAGHGEVAVRRQPRVALLATGNELVPPGTTPGPGQIVSSNGALLTALFTQAGAEVRNLGIARDELPAIVAAIGAARGADLLVTIGGASVGDHDLVAPALREAGATLDFWKVAIRPGKPVMTGQLDAMRVIGLPGNPVAAYVCALLFALPLIRAMLGMPNPLPRVIQATAAVPLPANDRRRDHVRATYADGRVTPATRQDSAMLSVLATSNALIVRPPHAPPVAAGEHVGIILLDSDSFGS